MHGMDEWLHAYELRRSSKNSKELKEHNEKWISSKYDIQNMHWTELQQLYLPDLGMCWGPACNSLKKLWKSYKIAGRTGEVRSDIAWNIRNIQRAMGIPESQFEELEGMDDEETEAQEVEENWGFNSGITNDKWLKNNLVKLLEIERDWLKDERFPKKELEHLKWDIKMSEEILYLIKKNDDCQFTWLLALDGCQFTWLVEHLHFLKSIFENCTDIDHNHNHKKCKDDLKIVNEYLKIYMSKMLSLNYLIDFLEYTISFCNYCDNYSEILKDCDGDIELAKSEILEVKNTLRIAKQILKLCQVARGAKQLILTKEQRECLHQELKAYVNRRQVVYRQVPTPDNKLSENELQTINGILTDIKP